MSGDSHHELLRSLFHELCDLPTDERRRVLEEREVSPAIAAELEALLEYRDRPGALDEASLGDVARRLVARDADSAGREEIATPSGEVAFGERLERLYGEGADPRVTLAGVADDDGQRPGDMARRLAARTSVEARYELLGEVARGGMGAILRVWDNNLRRHLAMKVILPRAGSPAPGGAPQVDPRIVARFLEEAQVTGQLEHPGIVPVHELGIDGDGRVFFTMRLVRGRNLREVLALAATGAEGWSRTRVVGVLLKVCEAMAFAHSRGVVHRDLKPANVMVGRFGEVYVMDWGIAKLAGRACGTGARGDAISSDRQDALESAPDSTLATVGGAVIGTPAYMAPEQASGRSGDVAPRSDVYSAGAMLYLLLAGCVPYGDPAAGRRRATVERGPPTPVHELSPDAPAELVAICAKAMQRDPGDRYGSMDELADDLRAYLEGRVVRAHESGALAEFRKWVSRNRGLAATAAAAVLSVMAVLGVSSAVLAGKNEQLSGSNARLAQKTAEAQANAREANEQRVDAVTARDEAERERKNVLGLSAFRELAQLQAQAQELWPAHPDELDAMLAWMRRARALVETLERGAGGYPGHLAMLRELEREALPRTEAERRAERESHPRFAELAPLDARIAALEYADAVRHGERAADVVELDARAAALSAAALCAAARPLVDPARESFGDEALGLALARLAVERAPDDPLSAGTLAWASLANGLDDDALAAAEAALAAAGPGREEELRGLLARLAGELARARGDRFATRLAEARAQLAQLEVALQERTTWRFADDAQGWWHEQLATLIGAIGAFADEHTGLAGSGTSVEHGWGVGRRLEEARRLDGLFAQGGSLRARWQSVLPEIQALPGYPAELPVQMGLVPIGPDPESGLWEFWHVQSGTEPVRDARGRLLLAQESGLVLVLVPGGTFALGAQRGEPSARNYDAWAQGDESPVREVALSPYFLSKFEMTQGQWERLAGSNPSLYGPRDYSPDWSASGAGWSALHPVEQVSWDDCARVLARFGLALPSEAQWEHAARAETETPWWPGLDPEALASAANLADAHAASHGGPSGWSYERWDDGYTVHAPVGRLRANAFGLYDVHGNVWEWCLDGYEGGFYASAPTADPVAPHASSAIRVYRGGGFYNNAVNSRSAYRSGAAPASAVSDLGVRPARAVATRAAGDRFPRGG